MTDDFSHAEERPGEQSNGSNVANYMKCCLEKALELEFTMPAAVAQTPAESGNEGFYKDCADTLAAPPAGHIPQA